MRHVLRLFILVFVVPSLWTDLLAQNGSYPWSLGLGGRMIRYQVPQGKPPLAYAGLDPAAHLTVSKYLNGAFDFRTHLTVGPGVHLPGDEALGRGLLLDMSYQLVFKLHNGVLLRESAWLSPYFIAGVGGSYLPNRPDAYLPLGAGVRLRFGPRMSLHLESVRQYSLNRDYQYLAHAIAFVYNLDTEEVRIPEELQETPEDAALLAMLPADRDGDGVIDPLDQCPDRAGLVAWQGCPQDPDAGLEMSPAVAIEAVPRPSPDADVTTDTLLPALPAEEEEAGVALRLSHPDNDEVPAEGHLSDIFAQGARPQPEPAVTIAEKPRTEAWVPPSTEAAPAAAPTKANRPAPAEPVPCQAMREMALDPIFFAYGSDELSPAAKQVLDQLAEQMSACETTQLVIQGHTDATGDQRANLVLSVTRAYNVKYYLVYEHGIPQARITSEGMGEQAPLAQNDTEQGRQRNRRVDFRLAF